MRNELDISGGTTIVILIALYFVIKWAMKNGIKEAYSAMINKSHFFGSKLTELKARNVSWLKGKKV